MPRKSSSKNDGKPTAEKKPARSRTTKRPTTKRSGQDQQPADSMNKVNDHGKAFEHQERDRGEVF
jgi:hypothetical protein